MHRPKPLSVNRPAVDAGLAILHEGGDFADDLIAYEAIGFVARICFHVALSAT